jgi:serine/threonine protein kinase
MRIEAAITLLRKILQIDARERCSAVEALTSQYLAPYHDPQDEPTADEVFDWTFFEADLPAEIWKTIMYETKSIPSPPPSKSLGDLLVKLNSRITVSCYN